MSPLHWPLLTRDPIKDGRNWYDYGGGFANPVNGADPNGLAWIIVRGDVEVSRSAVLASNLIAPFLKTTTTNRQARRYWSCSSWSAPNETSHPKVETPAS